MKYKKILLFALLIVVLSTCVNAGLFDKMQSGASKFTSKFDNVDDYYDKHSKGIDFIVFFTIFTAIAMMGLLQVFKDSGKNAAIVLSLALGAMLGFAALKAGMNAKFFIPFVKNILFFIVFLAVYLVLTKVAGMEKKWLAFILALVITFIVYSVVIFSEDLKVDLTSTPDDIESQIELLKEEIKELQEELAECKKDPARKAECDRIQKMIDLKEKQIKELLEKLDKEKKDEIRAERLDELEKEFDAFLDNPPEDQAEKLRLLREFMVRLAKYDKDI